MCDHIDGNRGEAVIKNFVKKYTERQGKQLYVRYPTKWPLSENEFQQKAKTLSKLVVSAQKPRQKHARFCLLNFKSKQDRNAALEDIRLKVKSDKDFRGIVVSIPRTESDEFLQKLADKKLKSMEMKKSKWRIKRASKKALRLQNLTSSITVQNLPKTFSLSEIKNLFPNAVDINIKKKVDRNTDYNLATITLSSTAEAGLAVKKSIFVGDKQLKVRLGTIKKNSVKKLGKRS